MSDCSIPGLHVIYINTFPFCVQLCHCEFTLDLDVVQFYSWPKINW